MSRRKWRETKLQLIWWPELALLWCLLVSLHFLCDILSSHPVHVYVHKLDFHVVAAISMNHTGSRSNSLEADVGHASATREGGEGAAERDHSSRRRHQTTLAVISLDTTPGNTDVEAGGGADQVQTELECFPVTRSNQTPSLQDDEQPTRILRSRYLTVRKKWYILLRYVSLLSFSNF